MRTIHLSARSARLLRDNLTGNREGYSYAELLRLDHLAQKLSQVQGEYDTAMSELARRERAARRAAVRATSPAEAVEVSRELGLIAFDAEDAHEAAAGVAVEIQVEESDWRLINDKLDGVGQWVGGDDMRSVIIGMVEAVRGAESDVEEQAAPAKLRRR